MNPLLIGISNTVVLALLTLGLGVQAIFSGNYIFAGFLFLYTGFKFTQVINLVEIVKKMEEQTKLFLEELKKQNDSKGL